MSGSDETPRGVGAPPLLAQPTPGSVPHTLGKYRFVATLGHGGMADVFLAVAMGPAGFNKLQVIKRLRPGLAEDPVLSAMFLDEARLAARLNHRNVVQTNEVDRVDGQYFMAMEHLDGQPLHRILAQARRAGRALSPSLVSRIVCDALAGLHYAHELADYDGTPLGVVHRDVSPQNLFVTYDGQVKVVDFGIAKTARRAVDTDVGVIKGKVAYMAPEQAFGDVDRRADVFSAGVVLWELCADRRLWQDMGDPQILVALMDAVPRLRDHAPGVDPELARVCDRALALDRGDRYPDAAAMRADLERAAPPASAEALGAFVEALFHEQRQEIREALARQVDLVAQGADGDLLELDRGDRASLRPRRAVTMGDPERVPQTPPVTMGGDPPYAPRPISEAPASAETPPPSTLESRLMQGSPGPSAPPPPALPETRRRGRIALLSGALVVIGAVAYFAGSRQQVPAGPGTPAASVAPVEPAPPRTAVFAPSSTPVGAYIQVHVGASPSEARILVDGAALPSNPFDGKFMKDGAVHRIQVEAGGFVAQSRLAVFDKDVTLDLALLPRPKPADPQGMKPDPYR